MPYVIIQGCDVKMDFMDVNQVVLFLIFFIPGFISLKVYDLFIPSERRDFSKSFFEALDSRINPPQNSSNNEDP